MKRLFSVTGAIESAAPQPASAAVAALSSVERDCMIVYEGTFQSLDGEVVVTKEHLERIAQAYNARMAQAAALGNGTIADKYCAPVQLDHTTSSKDTVGRLKSMLEVRLATLLDGRQVWALFGKVTILGAENAERVSDGRWVHVSIGADFETGEIEELTITPFPAAGEASLLSARRLGVKTVATSTYKGKRITLYKDDSAGNYKANIEGRVYPIDADGDHIALEQAKYICQKNHLSQENSMNRYQKCKKHLMETEGMDEAKALSRLEEMDDDEISKMAGEADERMKKLSEEQDEEKKRLAAEEEEKKKLAAEEEEKKRLAQEEEQKRLSAEEDEKKKLAAQEEEKQRLAAEEKEKADKLAAEEEEKKRLAEEEAKKEEGEKKLSAIRAKISQLRAGSDSATKATRLALRKAKVTSRLASLRAKGRMTPAEIKKIDIEELASMPEDQWEKVYKLMEAREPVVHMGILGTQKAIEAADLDNEVKRLKLAEMEEETLEAMPMAKKARLANKGAEKETPAAAIDPKNVETLIQRLAKSSDPATLKETMPLVTAVLSEVKHLSFKENEVLSKSSERVQELEKAVGEMQKQNEALLDLINELTA